MSSARAAAPAGFGLRVPESWVEFDVWRATRTGDLARMLDARIAQSPELKPYRGGLLKALREAAGQAERHGALFCAAMTDLVDDAGMLAATAMVFQTEGEPDPADDTPEAIAGRMSAVAPTPESSTWRHVEVVEIPAGRAVRVAGIQTAQLGGRPVDCVVMQTLIPVPGRRGVLNVVLSSPQVELAEPMLDLFDAISSTLTWSTTTTSGEASLN